MKFNKNRLLIQNLREEIAKVAAFLGVSITDEQLDKMREHLHIDNFEKNESVNNESGKKFGVMNTDGKFIRKGVFLYALPI